jgi:hypothetical protein
MQPQTAIKLTPMQAIKAKCVECNCDPKDKGTYLDQITSCVDQTCPLWSLRPLNSRSKREAKEKRMLGMSESDKLNLIEKQQRFSAMKAKLKK